MRELKSGGGGGGSASTNQASQELQEEVRHLQAQNAALQKKIDSKSSRSNRLLTHSLAVLAENG